MIKVGLVGEDPNDTLSVKNLLEKRFQKKFRFLPLVKGIKGHQLDSAKIKKALPIEFNDKGCDFAIYVRDLDGFKSQTEKLNKKIEWFKILDSTVNSEGILLLNIWELEALILGDIGTFNKIYKTSHKVTQDPAFIKEPKELLKTLTYKSKNQFKESHCPDLFKKLDVSELEKTCRFFSEFITELDKK